MGGDWFEDGLGAAAVGCMPGWWSLFASGAVGVEVLGLGAEEGGVLGFGLDTDGAPD